MRTDALIMSGIKRRKNGRRRSARRTALREMRGNDSLKWAHRSQVVMQALRDTKTPHHEGSNRSRIAHLPDFFRGGNPDSLDFQTGRRIHSDLLSNISSDLSHPLCPVCHCGAEDEKGGEEKICAGKPSPSGINRRLSQKRAGLWKARSCRAQKLVHFTQRADRAGKSCGLKERYNSC